jgi:iron complex transport system ATP-binding protein
MIKIKNVTKKYGNKNVIDNVSLNIEKGKITSFIGPNGAGKSTLLSIISRLITKDEGQVFIEGTELSKWDNKSLAKKISILKQSNHTNIRLRIKELVSFGRFPYCNGNLSSEDLQYVDDAIGYLELKDIENKYLDELSGGQRERAYIAMIVAQNTDYILLDEPLNNLDMKHSVQIMKILKKLVRERNKTVILVIHDINFASCYSDYIVALKNGIVESEGSTNQIINKSILSNI